MIFSVLRVSLTGWRCILFVGGALILPAPAIGIAQPAGKTSREQPVPLHGWEERLGWKIRMNRGPADAWGDLPTALRLLQRGGLSDDLQQLYAAAYRVLVAKPEATFADVSADAAFRKLCAIQDRVHLGGPMLGAVHPRGASVWVRTVKPAAVHVRVKAGGFERTFGPVQTTEETDLSAVVAVDELTPGTSYEYGVLVDGREIPLPSGARLVTAPEQSAVGQVRIAFGGDFHRWGFAHAPLIDLILHNEPLAMIQVGDIAVSDRFTHVGLHRADYFLRDLFPAWGRLAARVPLYASWDDHDYLDNDLSGRPKNVTAEQQAAVWEVFRRSWNNPRYGFPDDRRGLFFRTRIGPADVIMTDTRYFRGKPPHGTMLGADQLRWLEEQLAACRGPFVILSSGTMWSDFVSDGKDSWGQFSPEERERIFSLIEQRRIGGVLLISGDRHGACGYRIARPSGFTFYEFEVGSLGGISGDAAPAGKAPEANGARLYHYGDGYAFGEFTFDTTQSDPTASFRLIQDDGRILHELILKRSQLMPPPAPR